MQHNHETYVIMPVAERNGIDLGLVTATALLACVISAVLIGRQSFWLDEIYAMVFTKDWHTMWEAWHLRGGNMWAYHVLLSIWRNFGTNELYIRTLSAIFAPLSVIAVYSLAQELFDRRIALLAGLLVACSSLLMKYAFETRSYSMYFFFTVLSSLYFVKAIKYETPKHWLFYVIASYLAFAAHFFAVLTLAAHFASLPLHPRFRQAWRPALISYLILAVLVISTLLVFGTHDKGNLDWIRPISEHTVYKFIYSFFGISIMLVFYKAITVISLPVIGWQLKKNGIKSSWPVLFNIGIILIPIIITILFSIIVKPVFMSRYLIPILAPMVILTAFTLIHLSEKVLNPVFLFSMVFMAIYSLTIDLQRYDRGRWADAVSMVANNIEPGDAVTFYTYQSAEEPFRYYWSMLPNPTQAPFIKLRSDYITDQERLAGGYDNTTADSIRRFTQSEINRKGLQEPPDMQALDNLTRDYKRVWLVLTYYRNRNGELKDPAKIIVAKLEKEYPLRQEYDFGNSKIILYKRS